eukprot:COSAG02_NODE_12884_length_1477_cov_0.809869_1_plen_97_part_00
MSRQDLQRSFALRDTRLLFKLLFKLGQSLRTSWKKLQDLTTEVEGGEDEDSEEDASSSEKSELSRKEFVDAFLRPALEPEVLSRGFTWKDVEKVLA